MPTKTPIFVNVNARSGKSRDVLELAEQHQDDFEVIKTQSIEEIEVFLRQYAQHDKPYFIIAGGDGTINSILLMAMQFNLTIGILPSGTMNILARELGIRSHHLQDAWQVIQAQQVRQIDVFKMNEFPFIQMAGIGFDAQVVHETKQEMKRYLGSLAYIWTAFQCFTKKQPILQITCDHEMHVQAEAVIFGNGRFYGGSFPFFPQANQEDGRIDLLIIHEISFKMLRDLFIGLMRRDFSNLKTITCRQVSSCEISSHQPVAIEVDGEYKEHATFFKMQSCEQKLTFFAQ